MDSSFVQRGRMSFPVLCLVILQLTSMWIHTANADIYKCPAEDPCKKCNATCGKVQPWVCINIPPGYHDATIADNAEMVVAGYKGLTETDILQYRIVFHESAANYSCHHCSNVNKLFGFSRGFVPVMEKSCIFGWRKTIDQEPKNKIQTYGYGWYNSSLPPWETPGQMPKMSLLEVEKEYVFVLKKFETNCTYDIYDGNTFEHLSSAWTLQMPPNEGPSYYFALYYGGDEAAITEVTVSYTIDVCCGHPRCPFFPGSNHMKPKSHQM